MFGAVAVTPEDRDRAVQIATDVLVGTRYEAARFDEEAVRIVEGVLASMVVDALAEHGLFGADAELRAAARDLYEAADAVSVKVYLRDPEYKDAPERVDLTDAMNRVAAALAPSGEREPNPPLGPLDETPESWQRFLGRPSGERER